MKSKKKKDEGYLEISIVFTLDDCKTTSDVKEKLNDFIEGVNKAIYNLNEVKAKAGGLIIEVDKLEKYIKSNLKAVI